jgi:hypothetical protein
MPYSQSPFHFVQAESPHENPFAYPGNCDGLLLSAQSIEQVLVNGRQYEALAAIDSLPAFG